MRNGKHGYVLGVLICLPLVVSVLFLSGCSQPAPQATATPTKTPTRAATPVPVVVATAIPTATPTPAPTDTPTVTPLPTGLIIPSQDPNVSPFTGLPYSDPEIANRRPLAIKVANTENIRPQNGLSEADVVIEQRVEFNLTRFTVIYQSQGAERIGSIRSARLPDLEWPAVFDAILCFSGGVQPVRNKIYASDFKDRVLEQALNGAAYYRDPRIAVPNNLFASTTTLWKVAQQRGWNQRPQPELGWVFSEALPAGNQAVQAINIPYPTASDRVEWRYDAATGRWLRRQGGVVQKDATTGQQLSAANVVVMAANHVPTLILEHGTVDTGLNRSIEIQVWVEGPLTVYRDGQAISGRWIRPGRTVPLVFVDGNGGAIPLKPGNTWLEMVPLDMKVSAQ